MPIRQSALRAFVGAALLMACGGAPARPTTPPPVEQWDFQAWFREKPCFTRAEWVEIFVRFDPAMQIARDYVVAAMARAEPQAALAVATLEPLRRGRGRDRAVSGVAHFEQDGKQVLISVSASGLSPGEHGLTIHDSESCAEVRRRPDDHWNPTGSAHGPIGSPIRHVGDFGNLLADEQGRADLIVLTDSLLVAGDGSVVGKTVAIHARRDDGKTQTGSAGPAIACGVVRLRGDDVARGPSAATVRR